MTKEQCIIFDEKLDKMETEDILYFNGFKDAIQFLVNVIFPIKKRDLYNIKDVSMRYTFSRLLFNMRDDLEENLVDEMFRRMDRNIEIYKDKYFIDEEEEDDDDDFDDFLIDPGKELPDPSIDFMNIGGKKDD